MAMLIASLFAALKGRASTGRAAKAARNQAAQGNARSDPISKLDT
jgi:hypothetical protein